MAVVCGAGVLLSECGLTSEITGWFLTALGSVRLTNDTSHLGGNIAPGANEKELVFFDVVIFLLTLFLHLENIYETLIGCKL